VRPASVLASVLCGLQIAVADPPTLVGGSAARNDFTTTRSARRTMTIFLLRFPKIDVRQPAETGADLSIVRSIFRLDPDVTAAEDTPGRRSGQIVRPLNLIASGHVRFPWSTSALNSMHTSRLVVVLLLAPKPPRA